MTQAKPDTPEKLTRKRVVLLATNSSHSIIGEIVDGKTNAIAYSAYGEQSAQQEVATRLGFNGQLRERNIGWYLLGNGYRAYNTRLMRFHSPDSWSPFGGGGLNAYMYCVGDPVNRSDPTGHIVGLFVAASILDKIGLTMPGTIPSQRPSIFKGAVNLFGAGRSGGGLGGGNGDGMLGALLGAADTTHGQMNRPGWTAGKQHSFYTNTPGDAGGGHIRPPPPFPPTVFIARKFGPNPSPSQQPYQRSAASPSERYRSSFDEPRTLYKGPAPKSPKLEHERLLGTGVPSGPTGPHVNQGPSRPTSPTWSSSSESETDSMMERRWDAAKSDWTASDSSRSSSPGPSSRIRRS